MLWWSTPVGTGGPWADVLSVSLRLHTVWDLWKLFTQETSE